MELNDNKEDNAESALNDLVLQTKYNHGVLH